MEIFLLMMQVIWRLGNLTNILGKLTNRAVIGRMSEKKWRNPTFSKKLLYSEYD